MGCDVKVGDERTLLDGYTAVVTDVDGIACTITFKGTNIVKTVSAETFKYGIFDSYRPFKEGHSFSDIHLGERRYQEPGEIIKEGEEGTVIFCDDDAKLVYVAFEKLGKVFCSSYDNFYSRRMLKYPSFFEYELESFKKSIPKREKELKDAKKREEKRMKDIEREHKKREKEARRLQLLKETSESVMLNWFNFDDGQGEVWLGRLQREADIEIYCFKPDCHSSMPDRISGTVPRAKRLLPEDRAEIQDFYSNFLVSRCERLDPKKYVAKLVSDRHITVRCAKCEKFCVSFDSVYAPSIEKIVEAKENGDVSRLHVLVEIIGSILEYNLVNGLLYLHGFPFKKDDELDGYVNSLYEGYVFRNFEIKSINSYYSSMRGTPDVSNYELSVDYEVRDKKGKIVNSGSFSTIRELLDERRKKYERRRKKTK